MAAPNAGLEWSAQLVANYSSRSARIPGDKIILPPSALESLLSASANAAASSLGPAPSYDPWDARQYTIYQETLRERQQQLPHPLTFRLVNPGNGRVVYAGIQEFSAEEGDVLLSPFLASSLAVKKSRVAHSSEEPGTNGAETQSVDPDTITVHFQLLEKGTYCRLRPLEAGYDAEDWKALLEQHMRANFTTLTRGEILEVPGEAGLAQDASTFRFLVDEFKPSTEAICIVDTDLEVDIEALNEEQARETVEKIAAKYQNRESHDAGSSKGHDLDIFNRFSGQVVPGEYVDYQLLSWPRHQPIEMELTRSPDADDVDLLVSPFSSRQRARPRAENYIFADWTDRPSKRVRIQPSNVELEGAEALYVSVYAFRSPVHSSPTDAAPHQFTIRARPLDDTPISPVKDEDAQEIPPNDGDVRCKNCRQWVPHRTLMLHENFCLRNNVVCPKGCGQVFQKRSEAHERHWHCPHDTFFGNSSLSHEKHNALYHPPEPLKCSRCTTAQTFSSIPLLAQHRATTCPSKIILCRFCHLAVPQEGDPDEPNAEALLSGLTVHELQDGSRTTECHLCGKITRMRDMDTHMKHHNLERKSRPRPRPCRNANCGNTLDGTSAKGGTRAGNALGNDVGLCNTCFGPLYVSLYDPDGKALKRRVERRYLQQLLTGCGKSWCQNEFCRTGRKNLNRPEEGTATKTAIPMAKPFVDATVLEQGRPLHFCVDEAGTRRRERALLLEATLQDVPGRSGFAFPWCLAAVEAEGGDIDKAKSWLENFAPRTDEERIS